MLPAIRKKGIELESLGLKISNPKLKERTNTTGGIVHHHPRAQIVVVDGLTDVELVDLDARSWYRSIAIQICRDKSIAPAARTGSKYSRRNTILPPLVRTNTT
jgi:hypothetical protein